MSRRALKRFVYATGFFIFWLLVIGGVYYAYFRPQPSCFNNKHDVNEEGIDCGGVCAKVCLPLTFKPIQILGSVVTYYPDPDHVTLFTKVQNSNTDFAARHFTYTFRVYDVDGKVMQEKTDTSYLYKEDIAYLIVPNISIQPGARGADLEIRDPEWAKAATYKKAALTVQDARAAALDKTIRVEGKVLNQDTIPFPIIEVIALLKDTKGEVVAVSETKLMNVEPHDAPQFVILHPNTPGIEAQLTEVIARAERP